jgi:hypothetical protein
MTPEQVAAGYDRIASQWLDVSTYGFAQVERAVAFVKHKAAALEVGAARGGGWGCWAGTGSARTASTCRRP